MRGGLALIGFLTLLGCDSSSDDGGPCADHAGTYSIRFMARSGNCGDISEQIVTLPAGPPMLPAGCTGTIESSADNCRTTYDEACLLPLNKGTSQLKGVATWTTDSSSAHEVTELTIFDPTGQLLCSGTYDITDTKL